MWTKRKYILVEWPDIQYYMEHKNYKKEVYYDSEKGVWFVPAKWEEDIEINWNEGYDTIGPDIGDLDDAMG